jgi:hypothetical protein
LYDVFALVGQEVLATPVEQVAYRAASHMLSATMETSILAATTTCKMNKILKSTTHVMEGGQPFIT